MREIYEGLGRNDLMNVQRYMDICRNTQSADHFRKKTGGQAGDEPDSPQAKTARNSKSPNYQYEPLVGDPCYRYNKHAKERFFKNVYLAYLFIQFTYYFGNEYTINKQWRVPPYQQLADKHPSDHEGRIQILKYIFMEFVKLSYKTLKRF